MLRISLITACRNPGPSLGLTLRSVLAQRGNFELEHLVQDGASSDGTRELVASYARAAPYPVRYISETDTGFYDAVNRGIARAHGDLIGLLNADDWLAYSSVLADVTTRLSTPGAPAALHADLNYVRLLTPVPSCSGDFASDFVSPPYCIVRNWRAGLGGRVRYRWGWMPPHPTVYVRREVYSSLGAYRTDFGSAADYEWMVRVFVAGSINSDYIPKVTVAMQTGGQSNRSLFARLKANRRDQDAWRVNHVNPSIFLRLLKPARKIPQFWCTRAVQQGAPHG